MRPVHLSPLLLALLAGPLGAQAAASRSAAPAAAPAPTPTSVADSARRLLDRAVVTGRLPELRAARAFAERGLALFAKEPLLQHYVAYGLYREAVLTEESAERTAALTRAITLLEASDAARPLPETAALLGSVHGLLAGGGMLAAMKHGRAASRWMETALTRAPDNPRVRLLAGISSFYMPPAFGGSLTKAQEHFTRARNGFAATPPVPLPAWGRAEVEAWRGQVLAKQGDSTGARAAYQDALALEPEFGWVKFVLLPSLERGG